MRMSCNGCRVLRKGCSDSCTIRPCLQWIKSAESQANATLFLAKFYGRAGLLNLLSAPPGADSTLLRGPAAVFRSLLYEACGRIVNPVYGSVGLLWSGHWHACQAAVEAVLKGQQPVVVAQAHAGSEAAVAPPPRYDIRHVTKQKQDPDGIVARGGRKRGAESSANSKPSSSNKRRAWAGPGKNEPAFGPRPQEQLELEPEPVPMVVEHGHDEEEYACSHDDDHHHHLQTQQGSEDTDVEAASHVSQAEAELQSQHAPPVSRSRLQEEEEVGLDLELTLGLEPLGSQRQPKSLRCDDHSGLSAASSLICLRLQLPA